MELQESGTKKKSPLPQSLSPLLAPLPFFSLQHSVPIHLFRVWFKSSRDVEESCYIVWNAPEILSGFIISSFYNQHCGCFRIHQRVIAEPLI